ncbi:MAG: putative porin, partial [Tannerella sp.]|nr:putative porin [Tannerella sp.]
MKRDIVLTVVLLLAGLSQVLTAQSPKKGITPKLSVAPADMPDSLLFQDTVQVVSKPLTVYRLTDNFDRYVAPMDTMRLNFANSRLMEGRGLAVGYLANIGSPAQSRIFAERGEDNDFIFANAYKHYIVNRRNALFYDVKEPYTRLDYLRAGGQKDREEVLDGVMTSNFGRALNVGLEFNYTYVRGQYTSNSNQQFYYRPFVSYLAERYELNAYFRNHNYLNTENGGLSNDRYITHPDDFTDNKRPLDRQSYPVRFTNTWNRVKGKQLFLTHRYNLGFYREKTEAEKKEADKMREAKQQIEKEKAEEAAEEEAIAAQVTNAANAEGAPAPVAPDIFGDTDPTAGMAEEEEDAVFVPVSSIVHTFEYEDASRRFLSKYRDIDSNYVRAYDLDIYGSPDSVLDDYTEAWNMKNTIGLSLREGFQDWVKMGLTAFVAFDKRRFTLPGDSVRGTAVYDEFSTYIGAELSKQRGQLFTYTARGELCLVGSDLGEFTVVGELKTAFQLLGKNASIKARGHIKNLVPAFYLRHHHSRYFWWDKNLDNMQRVSVGGEIDIEQSRTNVSADVESIQNFVYFGASGVPEQFGSNLQVVTVRARQDFISRHFGWENEVAWQLSSDKSVLPLPQISAYSNLYIDFTYAKVLKIQLGVDAHYFTSYYAPYYEPATQQFQTQSEKTIGNYPIISAYANFRLKQARFF